MNAIIELVTGNLSKVGFGIILFLISYLANMILGAWQNVKMDGCKFDYHKILKSIVKFFVLVSGVAFLTTTVSVLPSYATYVGIEIEQGVLEVINGLVIVGGFITATVRYIKDALSKLSNILGNG